MRQQKHLYDRDVVCRRRSSRLGRRLSRVPVVIGAETDRLRNPGLQSFPNPLTSYLSSKHPFG